MPGPLPKDDAERRRRNAPTIPTTDVPASGYAGDIPEPVEELSELAHRYYVKAWSSPAAAAWLTIGVEAEVVAEWALLKADVSAIRRAGEVPAPALLSQLKALADALYLSPLARAKGRIKVVDDDVEELELAGAMVPGRR